MKTWAFLAIGCAGFSMCAPLAVAAKDPARIANDQIYFSLSAEQRVDPKPKSALRFIEGATVNGSLKPGDSLPPQSVGVFVYER